MSFSNYPYDQDKAFETFKLLDPIKQIINFGRTYGQGDLLPVDLTKVLSDPLLAYPFVREFSYSEQYTKVDFNAESTNHFQSIQLQSLYTEMMFYYVDIMNASKIAMGVVTELKSTIQHKAGANDIQFTITAKVVWFGPDFCDYV